MAMDERSRKGLVVALGAAFVAGTLSACGAAPGCTGAAAAHDCLVNAADVVAFARAPAGFGHKKAARVLVSNYALLTRNVAAADLPRTAYLAAGIAPEATGVDAAFRIYGYTRSQNSHAGDVFRTDYEIERVRRDGPDAALVTVVIGLTGVRPEDPTHTDSYEAATHLLRIERRTDGWVITGEGPAS
jgi:hypothetical protein